MSGPPPAKRKKGLSLDEKREVMMSILHETKEVYNLKDLEKLGSKAGVVLQTVQEVVKSLCDDRLVETDKIGSGNFFWSFPSKALVAKKTRLETLESSLAAEEKAIADMEARLAALSAGREDSASRTKDLAELGALRVQKAELEAAVKAYGDSDPEALKEMQKKVLVAKRSADRWTDNVWVLKEHLVTKYGKMPGEVDQMMGIPDDFDYLS